jgi:hypothetical protein
VLVCGPVRLRAVVLLYFSNRADQRQHPELEHELGSELFTANTAMWT